MVHEANLAELAVPVANVVRQIRDVGQKLAWTERLSPAESHAKRSSLIVKLLTHARQNVEYYKDRLDFDVGSPAGIDKAWSQIPILTRAEAVRHHYRLISARIPEEAGPVREGKTSGSTGLTLSFQAARAFDIANCALTERMFRWWRVDGKKSFAQIGSSTESKPSPYGKTAYGWQSARRNGVKYSLSHVFDIDTQLQWLLARRATYLSSMAGIIKELAATAKRREIALKFDLVFSAAAVVDGETRELCRSAFGAEIADTYGTAEAGHIAAQCPDCGEYHLSCDASVIEIQRDDGSPAGAGEIGRVIVTPLHNYAMPLIRYQLDDYAEAGTTQPACERKLPTLRRILGRSRNLFRFRDGTRVWPVLGRFVFLPDLIAYRQFQIVQTDFDQIEIRYVPEGEPGPVDLAALTQHVRTALNQRVDVRVRAVDKIDRTAAGKYEDCVSLVPSD